MIDQIESNDLSLTSGSKAFLNEAARWTKFLSILGFIFIGILIIVALFAGSFIAAAMEAQTGMGMLGGTVLTIIYLAMAALYFFPIYYLFQFSSKMKAALAQQSSELLQQAFENLKSHYKFMGILMIVVLGFYVIVLAFAGIGAAMM